MVDAANPANNRTLLDEGTLYVAQFDGDEAGTPLKGKGRWIALEFGKNGLTPENGFRDEAEVLIRPQGGTAGRGHQNGSSGVDRGEPA